MKHLLRTPPSLALCMLSLVTVAPLSGCDDGPAEAVTAPSAESMSERRANAARGAKADAPGTCADSCGGEGVGGCWCDEECAKYGDCCADKASLCDEAPACSDYICMMACPHGFKSDENGCAICACASAPESCDGHCGGKAESGCWCDDECAKYGDCCGDKAAVCEAPEPCYVGGCSGQLCTDTPGMISTCEYLPEYACFKQPFATCERQSNGACGWTPDEKLDSCIADAVCKPVLCEEACPYGFAQDDNGCYTCECAAPICPPVALPNPAACPDGTWTPTYDAGGECIEGFECISNDPCFATGCGGTMCADHEVVNVWCPQDDVHACYEQKFAECKRQSDGECGWTKSAELDACVDNGGVCSPVMCKMYCEFGWATDPKTGCEICACAEPPVCDGLLLCKIDCPNGYVQDDEGCDTCECAPVVCEPLACKMDCPFGLVRDANGCDTCACAEPVGCQGVCGGKSAEGCWCDASCETYGDCCDNKAQVCQ